MPSSVSKTSPRCCRYRPVLGLCLQNLAEAHDNAGALAAMASICAVGIINHPPRRPNHNFYRWYIYQSHMGG